MNENAKRAFLINEPGKEQRESFKQLETSSNLLLSRVAKFLPELAQENAKLFKDLETGAVKAEDVDIQVLDNVEQEDGKEPHIEMVCILCQQI